MSHTIRLGYPWRLTDSSQYQLEFRRNFNRPTGIEAGQHVWLVVTCTEAVRLNELSLNGSVLSVGEYSLAPLKFSIGKGIQASNQLVIKLSCPASSISSQCPTTGRLDRIDLGQWATVHLEIEAPTNGN